MAAKLQPFFDAGTARKGNTEMYKKAFQIREKRPADFIMSVLFSALTDAKEHDTPIYLINEKLFRDDDVHFRFKRVRR